MNSILRLTPRSLAISVLVLIGCGPLEAEDLEVEWRGTVSWFDKEGNTTTIDLESCELTTEEGAAEPGCNDGSEGTPPQFVTTLLCPGITLTAFYDAEGYLSYGRPSIDFGIVSTSPNAPERCMDRSILPGLNAVNVPNQDGDTYQLPWQVTLAGGEYRSPVSMNATDRCGIVEWSFAVASK